MRLPQTRPDQIDRKTVQAVLRQAIGLHQSGRFAEAEQLYSRILSADKNNFDALRLLGMLEAQRGDLAKAHELLRDALELSPRSVDVLINLGNVLKLQERLDAALEVYSKALKIEPNSILALSNRGSVLSALGRFDDARASFDAALQIKHDYSDALYNRGNLFITLRRPAEAFADLDKALALQPDDPQILVARGNALMALGRLDEGIADFNRALTIQPAFAEAMVSLGAVLAKQKRFNEALASYDRALATRPNYAEALSNRGATLHELKRFNEALVSVDGALALQPDFAEALVNRGRTLCALKRYDDALAAYGRALALRCDLPAAWLGRGTVLAELKRYDDALAAYDKALALQPDLVEASIGRGNVFGEMAQYENAFAAYDSAFTLKPDAEYLQSSRLHAKLMTCNWTHWEAEVSRLILAVRNGAPAHPTFLSLPSSPADQLTCARRFVADCHPPSYPSLWQREVHSHDRIRIAYLSSDFREHPIAHLTAGLFEQHDKSRFELTAISFGPEQDSGIRRRIKASFEHFIEARSCSDREIAELVQQREIDIAVDLNGLTKSSRTDVFASRAAPIQVNYLGYPGTMGAGYIDYIIADRFVIPECQHVHYQEKVVYLPDCFQVNSSTRSFSGVVPTRAEAGLPESGFVFCSFCNNYKMTPTMFDIWMRVLQQVEGSVLWLLKSNPAVESNLRAEAVSRGLASGRLIFAPRIEFSAYLTRYRLADLFLDTFPYNGGTTASDALWAGLPLVTCCGETFAARMAGSLLNAAGLPELIAHSLEEYQQLALKLAHDPALLASLKARLACHGDSCPLFDTARFTRHLEAAYSNMWELWQRGEPARSFSVPNALQ